MVLEIEAGEIRAIVVFNERSKLDPNSSINPDLNEKVTMWLFLRLVSYTSTAAHGWVGQV